MPSNEVPVLFLALLAVGVVAVLGGFRCAYLIIRKLGLTMTRHGSEWHMSREDNSVFGKAVWGGNDRLAQMGVLRLVWALRLLFLVVAASVAGCFLTLAGAAK